MEVIFLVVNVPNQPNTNPREKIGGCPKWEIPFKNVLKRAILNWAMTFLDKNCLNLCPNTHGLNKACYSIGRQLNAERTTRMVTTR